MNDASKLYTLPTHSKESFRSHLFAVMIGFAVIAAGWVAATQFMAHRFGYQPALGPPIVAVQGVKLYAPWKWPFWSMRFGNIQTAKVQTTVFFTILIGLAASGSGVGAAVILRYRNRRLNKATDDLHGSARWATAKDLNTMGFLSDGGIFVGGFEEGGKLRYLRHDGPEHVSVVAPTRSGKGVSIVLPTALSYEHSLWAYDIKGELYALTAGYRSKVLGQRVIRFSPGEWEPRDDSFNPMEEIRLGTPFEVGDAQNIAQMIVDPDGKGMADHWAKTSHELLSASLLHVLYSWPDKTLRGLVGFFCDPTRPIEQVAADMLQTEHDPTGQYGWLDPTTGQPTRTHPMIAQAARSFLNKSENERSGVQSTALSFLTIYRDPIVARATERSTFTIESLVNSEKPVSFYFVVSPETMDRVKPLTRLVISMIIKRLVREMRFEGGRAVRPHKHKLLLLIDELPSLGRMEPLSQALPFMAGYGLRALMIYQDKAQLDAAYGKEQTIWANSHVRIAFAPNDAGTAKFLSEHLGKRTVQYSEHSLSGKRFGAGLGNTSINTQRIGRELLTADELMRLPAAEKSPDGLKILRPGNLIAIVAGFPPVFGIQPLYFLDPTLSARSKLAPPYMPGVPGRGGQATTTSAPMAPPAAPAPLPPPTTPAALAESPAVVATAAAVTAAPVAMRYDETTEIPSDVPPLDDAYGDPIDLDGEVPPDDSAAAEAAHASAAPSSANAWTDFSTIFAAASDSSLDSAELADLDRLLTASADDAEKPAKPSGPAAVAAQPAADDSSPAIAAIDDAISLLLDKT